ARAPREIVLEFDSDEARRTARLGRTLYLAGGEILQYDGQGLYEVGFHIYPWRLGGSETGSGAVDDGTYSCKGTWRWDSAVGDRDRSTTATHELVEVDDGPSKILLSIPPLTVTHKDGIAAEFWRQQKNAPLDAPFHLVSGQAPGTTTGDNAY